MTGPGKYQTREGAIVTIRKKGKLERPRSSEWLWIDEVGFTYRADGTFHLEPGLKYGQDLVKRLDGKGSLRRKARNTQETITKKRDNLMKNKLSPGDVKDYYVAEFSTGTRIRIMRRKVTKKGLLTNTYQDEQETGKGWVKRTAGFVRKSKYLPSRNAARVVRAELKAKLGL